MSEAERVAIVPARSDDDLSTMIDVRVRADPEARPTLEGLRHNLATDPNLLYVVAYEDGAGVACGFADEGAGDAAGAHAVVVPEARRRGIGTAVLRRLSDHARTLGKEALLIEVRMDDPDAVAFLERRGYVEVERQLALALELAGADPTPPPLPPGVRIVSRAERPDVVRGMYETAEEGSRDIPGIDGARETSFEAWKAHEIDRPSRRPELTFVALAGDDVVGYAGLDVFQDAVYHGLTVVRRAWRRKGIARALKVAQIAAAKEAGFERLVTESEARNVPMESLNRSLGYRPAPGSTIVFRGPLF
jgi:mycothiol synthase